MKNIFIIGIFNSANEFLSLITFLTLSLSLFHQKLLQKKSGQVNSYVLMCLTIGFMSNTIILFIRQMIHVEKFSGDLPVLMSLFLILQILVPVTHFLTNKRDSDKKESSIFCFKVAILFLINLSGLILIAMGIELPAQAIFLIKSIVLIILFGIITTAFINLKNQQKEQNESNSINSFVLLDNSFLLSSLIISFFIVLQYMFNGVHYHYYGSVIFTLTAICTIVFIRKVKEQKHRYNEIIEELKKSDKILRMEDNKAYELKTRLIKYFEKEKPYLNKDLSIIEVSVFLYTNKTYLSKIINDYMGQNFNQFTNSYRIEEVKRLFIADRNLTIQELCKKSGFGCMASFTIAFRIFLGSSPADWCKSIRNQWDTNEES